MIKKTLMLIALCLSFTAAEAETTQSDPPIISLNKLAANQIPDCVEARGGPGSSKPLGFYIMEPKTEFRSSYAKQSPAHMAEFALALHDFIVAQGGGYNNFVNTYLDLKSKARSHTAIQNRPVDAKAMQMLEESMAKKQALEQKHIKYDAQIQFAKTWWSNKNTDYMASGLTREWFLNDAILDASFLWLKYETKYLAADDGLRNSYAQYEWEEIAHKR